MELLPILIITNVVFFIGYFVGKQKGFVDGKKEGFVDGMNTTLKEVENDPKQITNEMIVGIYEMVTEYLQPYDF